MSSNAQAMGRISFADLQGESSYSGSTAYNQSKLANVIFTHELARRLRHTGAATSIHLVSSPDLENVSGQYFANSKPKRSAKRSYDEATAARLWQVSSDLVGLGAGT